MPAGPRAALLALALTALAVPAAAAAADLALVVAEWRAGALGRQATGLLAWVSGPGQELRLDVLAPREGAGPPPAGEDVDGRDALLWRQGRGWTLVAGAGGEPGVLEPWDREWRPAPAGLEDLARAVAAATPGHPRRLVVAQAAAAAAESDGPTTATPGLRQALVRRGRGGGGPGERVSVTVTTAGPVRVCSSRRPGALEIRPVATLRVAVDPASVYAPWWPLGEVVPGLQELMPEAGTRAADGR